MIIVGPGKALKEIEPDLDWKALDKEELIIRTKGNHLILMGGRPRGTLYAVYEFLEKYLNCRWYTKDAAYIPKQSTIQLEAIDYRYNPSFMYREVLYKNAFEKEFSARQRLNGGYHQLDESTGGTVTIFPYVHTFASLVPPNIYFESHPEYFSLIDGKRVPDKQLCLTNPDVLRIATEKVFSWIEEHPEIEIFEVSQNDGYGPCECEKCQAIVKEEGSEMGPILRFVNAIADEVAKKHPDKYIDTLSYAYSETPPLVTVPRDNVIIRLCHWAPACGVHGIGTCPTNESYRQELDGRFAVLTARICDNLRACSAGDSDKIKQVILRTVLFGAQKGDKITAKLNGVTLELAVEDYQWKDAQIFSPRPQPASGGKGDYTVDPEQKLLRLDFIVPPRLCHPGENQVSIRIIDRVPYEYGAVIMLEKVEVHLDYLSAQDG